MVFNKIKPDMTVYSVKLNTGLGSHKWSTWTVRIIEVDEENKKVYASWNGNEPRWYCEHSWKNWRVKRPTD
jgi:hypothetical protein